MRTTPSAFAGLFASLVAAAGCSSSASAPARDDAGWDAATPHNALGTPCVNNGSNYAQGCCHQDVTLPNGVPDAGPFDAGPSALPGQLSPAQCGEICLPGYNAFCSVEDAGPAIVVQCWPNCTGRRPALLRADDARQARPLAAYFARVAQLEAASVPAFRRAARELAQLGAPRELVRACERAAREEIRHARAAKGLARRFGAEHASFEVGVASDRSLEDFAIENAVEGCVRETYGALVATWQSRAADDRDVRAFFTKVAREETSHASLAWRIDAWARARLDRGARRRVEEAARRARTELRATLEMEPAAELVRVAGAPSASVAIELASRLTAALERAA